MPIYDYRCPQCGDFRASRPMAESAAAVACPACGRASARCLSAPFVVSKGGTPGVTQTPRDRMAHMCGAGCNH